MTRREELAQARERVEALPVHSISGYEWDCGICEYNAPDGDWDTRDPNGRVCDHRDLLDRAAVLEILSDLGPDA